MAEIKQTQYLIRPYSMQDEEFNKLKQAYKKRGIKLVVFSEGKRNIHEGLKGILLNHQ